MPVKKPHNIPVKAGQIRYLLSLAPFADQEALARKLGTSTRYLRRMLSGQRPGYKYSTKIWKLYESHRRKATPQLPPKRPPKVEPRGGFVSMAAVVRVLQHIFQPTDAQAIPSAKRPWQDKATRYAATERKVRGKYSSWDGFSIVMVQGATDQGTISIRRYKPRGGGQHHLEGFEEERREEAEEFESQTVAEMIDRWNATPKRYADIVSHLPIDEWLDTIAENVFTEPIFNFWISRFSERGKAGGFANLRSPADPDTFEAVDSVARETAESATQEGGDFQFDHIGTYAFTGWNKKPGKKPPKQQ